MNGDDAFIERISDTLRAVERAPADFEGRVLDNVRAVRAQLVAQTARKPWLMRPHAFQARPIAALAMAAGFAALVLGTASLATGGGTDAGQTVATASPDTVHIVRFLLADSQATGISLVGSFNQWEKSATPLQQVAPGIWSVQLRLSADRHEYAFVIRDRNGERWVGDPLAVTVRDEFGTESSIIDLTSVSTS